jgi:hypothetical protein
MFVSRDLCPPHGPLRPFPHRQPAAGSAVVAATTTRMTSSSHIAQNERVYTRVSSSHLIRSDLIRNHPFLRSAERKMPSLLLGFLAWACLAACEEVGPVPVERAGVRQLQGAAGPQPFPCFFLYNNLTQNPPPPHTGSNSVTVSASPVPSPASSSGGSCAVIARACVYFACLAPPPPHV